VSYSGLRAPIRATRGVAKTVDGGRRWKPVYHHVQDAWLTERFNAEWVSNPLGPGVAPRASDVVYATDYGRALRTLDGGASWQAVYSTRMPDGGRTTNGLDITTSYGVHFDPFDPRRMFIGYTDIGLFASDNGGASWYSATRSGVPGSWVNTTYWMEFDPNVRGRVWAVMSGVHDPPRPKMWRHRSPETYDGGVVRSDDGGRTPASGGACSSPPTGESAGPSRTPASTAGIRLPGASRATRRARSMWWWLAAATTAASRTPGTAPSTARPTARSA